MHKRPHDTSKLCDSVACVSISEQKTVVSPFSIQSLVDVWLITSRYLERSARWGNSYGKQLQISFRV